VRTGRTPTMPTPPLPPHLQDVLAEGRGRLQYLKANPSVSLTVLDTGNPYAGRDRGRVSAWIEIDSWHAWNGGRPWT
jgi:hypothetical protein